jgi:hypothetical protein
MSRGARPASRLSLMPGQQSGQQIDRARELAQACAQSCNLRGLTLPSIPMLDLPSPLRGAQGPKRWYT